MFQDLVIWNETAHAKKTWSMNSLDAVFVATIQLLANCTSMQKEPNNAVGTYYESKSSRILSKKLSHVCHELEWPADIEEKAVFREATS